MSVRTRHGVTNRPVAKVYSLELTSEVTTDISNNRNAAIAQTKENSDQVDAQVTDSRPQCDAAQRARQKLGECHSWHPGG